LWALEADVSNSYPVLPNYTNGTFHFHFHKDLTGLRGILIETFKKVFFQTLRQMIDRR
jgi:hypothetical protein